MATINTRSPYYIKLEPTTGNVIESTTTNIKIWSGLVANPPTSNNYVITKTPLVSEPNNDVIIEVSELIRDYVELEYHESNLPAVWVKLDHTIVTNAGTINITETHLAVDGYGYFEDGINPQNDSIIFQSNNSIYTSDSHSFNIPVNVSSVATSIIFYYKGTRTYSRYIVPSTDSDEQIIYVSNLVTSVDLFKERVESFEDTFVEPECLREKIEEVYEVLEVDEVHVIQDDITKVIKIERIEECEYDPQKIMFYNKFGALQDLWFFKRSDLTTTVKKESYKSNILVQDSYSISSRQDTVYNKQGKEKLKLNSGYYPEYYNEVFKQLLLSENVWINYDNKILPVTITSSNLKYKTKLNDKLISYDMELEFAYNTINDIR